MVDENNNEKPWPKNLDEAVARIISELPAKDKALVRNMSYSDFVWGQHLGLGMYIRNQFGLWKGNEVLLKDLGNENMHPDSASIMILHAVWKVLQKENSITGKNKLSPEESALEGLTVLNEAQVDQALSHLPPRERLAGC